MLGAAPRTRLYGAVVLIAAAAAAAAALSPVSAGGRSLTATGAAPSPAKLWAIELSGKSRVALRPSRFRTFAADGINAVVTTRSSWTTARHTELVRLAKRNGLRVIELRDRPRNRNGALALHKACIGATDGADSCAVVVPSPAAARAWIRDASARYVVLRVASPKAFTRLRVRSTSTLNLRSTSRVRLLAIVPLPSSAPVGATWAAAINAVATGGPDLAVTAGGASSSPALSSYLGMLHAATTASKQPAEAPQSDTAAPAAPASITLLANGLDYITVGWADSTHDVDVTGYEYFLNGSSVGTTQDDYVRIGQLDCGTTYTVGVEAYDAAGNHSARTSFQTGTVAGCRPYLGGGGGGGGGTQTAAPTTVTTTTTVPNGDTSAPSTPAALTATAVSDSAATLSWSASTDDVGVTGYGLYVGSLRVATSAQTSYAFSGLSCGSNYTFGVDAYDAADNRSPVATMIVTTSDCPTTPPPGGDTSPPTTPTNLSQTAVSDSAATLTWSDSTDDVGVTGYGLYVGSLRVATSAQTSYAFSGLSCGSNYTFGVDAYDAAGNRSPVATLVVTTSACPTTPPPSPPPTGDTSPPTAPTNLSQTASTTSSVTAGWTASTDDVGVTGYDVLIDGNQAGTTATTSYALTGLSCETSHQVVVDAFDAAGNHSSQASATMTTAACPPPAPGDTTAPSTPGSLAVSGTTGSSISVSWAASSDNVGVTGYGVYSNGTLVGTPTVTSYTVSGLACGTSYSVAVDAHDAAGNRSGKATVSSTTAACADTQAPTAPTGVALVTRTTTSISIGWTASSDNVGVAGYHLYLGGSAVGTASGPAYTFTGLTCGTNYTLGVDAYDAAGNQSAQATTTLSTSACPDATPPSTPGSLVVSGTTGSSISVLWAASSDNVGVTGYGVYSNGTLVGSPSSTSYTLSGLTCGTSYTVAVDAVDAAGNRSAKATVSSTTAACADTQAPTVPGGVTLVTRTTTSISIGWTASSDNVGVAGYRLFLAGSPVGTTATTSYTFTDLTCGTNYTLGVDAYDAAANHSTQATIAISTIACPDTSAPSVPGGLTVGTRTTTSIALSWTASSDNVGVTGYGVYSNGSLAGSPTGTSYTLTGLTCGTSYSVDVDAVDAAGNRSAKATVTAATSACPDTSAPSVPAGLTVGTRTTTSIALSWSASSDNVGVTGYGVYSNGSLAGSPTGTSYTLSGLTCGTSYSVDVDAVDAAGNRSAKATVTAATSACPDTTAPSVPGSFTVTGSTQTSISVLWAASSDNVGVTGYGVYSNGTLVGSPTGTSYTLSGLSCGTLYTVAVDAVDTAGNRSAKATTTASTSTCPDTSAPSVPAGLTVGTRTTTSIALSWSASSDNVGVTGYGVYSNGSLVGSPTGTSYTLSGLACGTSYSVAVDAVDAAGNSSAKATTTASTSACPDTTAPSVPAGLTIGTRTTTSIALSWSASSDNVGVTGYGVYGNGTLAGSPASTSYTLSGLTCGTSYTVAVDAVDAAGNRSAKASITASTSACPDTAAPSVPGSFVVTGSTQTSISLSWAASSDNVGVTGYGVYSNGTLAGSPTATNYTVSGLSCGTLYSVAVDAADAAGNRSAKATTTAATSACPDTSAPSVPAGLAVGVTTTTSVALSWSASSDNVGVTGYGVYSNGTLAGSPTGTSYTLSGLTCGTSYTVAVDAVDAAGNRSAKATAIAATSACPDTTAPSVPAGLTVGTRTTTSVALSWSASSDNVGVTGYGVYGNGTLAGSPASTSYTLSGLTCGTSYTVAVDAVDAAGNRSAKASITASTSACPDTQAPTVPSGVALVTRTATSISIGWTASSDNVGVTGYGVYSNGTLAGSPTSTSYTLSGLTCGTSYTVAVDATDAAGNRSAKASLTGATSACPDTTAPSTPGSLGVSGATGTSITVSWAASSDNVGVTGYGVYSNGTLVGSPTSTSYTLSGLTCGTSYTVAVDAVDAAGNRSAKANVTTSTSACPDVTPPSAPGGLSASFVTQSAATLSWGASGDNVGVVGYHLYVSGVGVGSTVSTSYAFSGFSCGTNYSLGVDAYDAAGNRSAVSTRIVTTSACVDTSPPAAPTNLVESASTTTSITAMWTASSDNVGVTGYRVFLDGTLAGTTATTSYTLSGLACGTSHQVVVDAHDAAGNNSPQTSATMAATACPPPPPGDTTAPSIPTGLAVSSGGQTTLALSWNASSDNVGVTGYGVYRNGTLAGSPAATSYTLSGLSCGTSYTVAVDAADAAGNRSAKATITASTAACLDTQAPTVPSGVALATRTTTSISIGWTASTDNVGVAGYHLYLAGAAVGTATTTGYTFTGLTCNTNYTLGVDAYDAAGNKSAQAATAISTSACPDTTPPSTPAGLATSAIGQTSMTLSWTASSDNVGVAGYRLSANGTQVGTATTTSYAFSGLACGTGYSLGVVALDAAGNVSGTGTLSGATAACSSGSANVYVSPSGNDSTCVRGDQAHPCLSFAAACRKAQAGDVVGVASGTYAAQVMANTDCPNASSSAQIVFKGASTSGVPSVGAASDAPFIGGGCSSYCHGLTLESGGNFFGNGGSGTNGPSYVTFQNLHVQGNAEITGNQGQTGTGTTGVGIVLDHVTAGAILDVGLTNVLVKYSSFGGCTDGSIPSPCQDQSRDWSQGGAAGGGRQQTSGTFDHDIFHDYTVANSGGHFECYFALDWRALTIQNSWFYNCDISGPIRIERITNPGAGDQLTIQNNWFGRAADSVSGPQRCEGITWGANSGSLSNVLIRYNSFAGGEGPFGSSGSPTSSFRILGNLVGMDPTGSCEITPAALNYGSATVSGNVWIGHDLGSNSTHVASLTAFNAMYINSSDLASANYHLSGSPGSTAADNHVPCTSGDAQLTTDKDGNPRPQSTTCDAGAQER